MWTFMGIKCLKFSKKGCINLNILSIAFNLWHFVAFITFWYNTVFRDFSYFAVEISIWQIFLYLLNHFPNISLFSFCQKVSSINASLTVKYIVYRILYFTLFFRIINNKKIPYISYNSAQIKNISIFCRVFFYFNFKKFARNEFGLWSETKVRKKRFF